MQLRAHARAAFASQTNGSMNYPFTMLFHHVELAKERSRVRDNRYVTNQQVGTIASAARKLVQTPSTLNFIAADWQVMVLSDPWKENYSTPERKLV